MSVLDHDPTGSPETHPGFAYAQQAPKGGIEFDLLHDRFDSVDTAVARLHPPTDGLDLIIYSLCFLLGFFVRGVLT